MRTRFLAVVAAVFTAVSLAPVIAASIDTIVLSTEKGATETQATFAKDTPTIFVSAHVTDVAVGAKLTCTWVALDTQGAAPANTKIDTVELAVTDSKMNQISSSLSKPNAGWPAGTYEVDLAVDGEVVAKANFSVE